MFLYPEDAVENIKSPLDYRHMRMLRFALKLIFFWPRKELGEVKKGFSLLPVLICVQSYCVVFTLAYLVVKRHTHTFLEIGHIYITVLMSGLSLSRLLLLPTRAKYTTHVVEFIRKIHLFHYKNKSEYAMKIHKQIHIICHVITLVGVFQMILGVILFNAISLYSNIRQGKLQQKYLYNTTFELAVYYLYPSEAVTNRQTYIYVTIFNWCVSLLCCLLICMADLNVFLIVFHVWGHFKILLNNLYTFPRPALTEKFTPVEMKDITKKLKEYIDYHRFIAKCTDHISEAFGPMLFVYYLFHLISGCVMLLECSQMTVEALVRYGPLTLVINQELIEMSVIFEMINTASEKVKDAVYSIPWESFDESNRRTVLIFLMVSQKAVQVKALGMTPVGVTTMAALIKSSVTYFAFLRTVAE